MAALFLRRAWLIAAVIALAALTAWIAVQAQPKVYERTLVFVLRPGPAIKDAQIPDAIRGIAQEDAQLVRTVARVIRTDRFLALAFERAGGTISEDYTLTSSVSPGSDVIETRLRGPDADALARLGTAFARLASAWVARVYRAYELEFLEADVADGPVAPRTGETVLLAAMLAALISAAAVAGEARLRGRIARPVPPAETPIAEEQERPARSANAARRSVVTPAPPAATPIAEEEERTPARTTPAERRKRTVRGVSSTASEQPRVPKKRPRAGA